MAPETAGPMMYPVPQAVPTMVTPKAWLLLSDTSDATTLGKAINPEDHNVIRLSKIQNCTISDSSKESHCQGHGIIDTESKRECGEGNQDAGDDKNRLSS